MITLALDSSTGAGSIALHANGQTYATELLESGTQAGHMVSSIKELCAQAGCEAKDITRVFCPVGPGSFTGIRISLTVARILAFTTEAEAVGVNTLDCFALSCEESDFTVATRAGKGEAYVRHYKDGKATGDVELVLLSELSSPAIGNLEECTTTLPVPDMKRLAERTDSLSETHPLEPLYVRKPDAEPARPLEAR